MKWSSKKMNKNDRINQIREMGVRNMQSEKKISISVRMPELILKNIKYYARNSDRTTSTFMIMLIREGLSSFRKNKGKFTYKETAFFDLKKEIENEAKFDEVMKEFSAKTRFK